MAMMGANTCGPVRLAACMVLSASLVLPGTEARAHHDPTVSFRPTEDTEIWPPSPKWNGWKIYLSVACHNSSASGKCFSNHGCVYDSANVDYAYDNQEWPENSASLNFIHYTTLYRRQNEGVGLGNLIERGYAVRIGMGTYQQNRSRSNAWGADLHIPIHTNAGSWKCDSLYETNFGTWGLYNSAVDQEIAWQMMDAWRSGTPGGNDKVVFRSDLHELFANAPTGYLEVGFHTFAGDIAEMGLFGKNYWRIASGIDFCLGYPRSSADLNPFPWFTPQCPSIA